mmetsp:Transcript_37279/g.73895  ORF Transcript_37279/g.73895 Transcript_37279/m.73895 type:complete len:205 (+) Transcript_37279:952-1566(+)
MRCGCRRPSSNFPLPLPFTLCWRRRNCACWPCIAGYQCPLQQWQLAYQPWWERPHRPAMVFGAREWSVCALQQGRRQATVVRKTSACAVPSCKTTFTSRVSAAGKEFQQRAPTRTTPRPASQRTAGKSDGHDQRRRNGSRPQLCTASWVRRGRGCINKGCVGEAWPRNKQHAHAIWTCITAAFIAALKTLFCTGGWTVLVVWGR